MVSGCAGHGGVAPCGVGFEALSFMRKEPSGLIHAKKIGKKKKNRSVPISGSATGRSPGRTYSGVMSGTLTLTRKPPLLAGQF